MADSTELDVGAHVEGDALDTASSRPYGHILRAGQLVGVRGAGALYNGDYYVNKVTHNIERSKSTQQYTQSFELKRESLGAKKAKETS